MPLSFYPAVVYATAPGPAVTLKYKYVPGQVQRYKLHTSIDTTLAPARPGSPPTSNVTQDMVFKQTVLKVRVSDGAATSRGEIEEYHIFSNGKETGLPFPASAQMKKPYTVISLPNGKVLSIDDVGMPKGLISTFPLHPLKVGESWSEAVTTALGGESGLETNTFTGYDITGGGRRAIIQQKINRKITKAVAGGTGIPQVMAGTTTGDETLVFDLTTGTISRLASVTTLDLRLGTTTLRQRFQVTLTRLEDAKKSVSQ